MNPAHRKFRSASIFQWAETGDHLIPRLYRFGDGGGFVLARRWNCGAELAADGTGHAVHDFVTPVCRAAGAATYIGFGAASAMSRSHTFDDDPELVRYFLAHDRR
ncbi:MAG: hypothetical protein NT159_21695 [Proteobacteria bacterium]|nr:hypothetical protein [Pseudomonadota bacterium]